MANLPVPDLIAAAIVVVAIFALYLLTRGGRVQRQSTPFRPKSSFGTRPSRSYEPVHHFDTPPEQRAPYPSPAPPISGVLVSALNGNAS
jgi:hypothetical protein